MNFYYNHTGKEKPFELNLQKKYVKSENVAWV